MAELCKNGHPLTDGNFYLDRGHRRCKTCISKHKALRYSTDATFRKMQIAYAKWWRYGDPKGRSWPEIKAELVG